MSTESSPQPPEDDRPTQRITLAALWRSLRLALRGGWHTVRDVEPEFWRNLQAELTAGRQWLDRGVVLLFAALSGLLVIGFTFLAEHASDAFARLQSSGGWLRWTPLLLTPALTMLVLWLTRRFAPGAGGSGIQQVVRALDDDLPDAQRNWLVSLKLSFHKVGLVSGGLLAGLSIGREGPAVQICAGVMVHARRWLSPKSGIDAHDLMVAGAAAGIAAAFNTPLGGIMFAIEKLSRRRGISHSALVISCIVLAGLVSVSVFGNQTYFGQLRVQTLTTSMLLPGLLVALTAGLAGGLFSRLLVVSMRGLPDRFSRWRRSYPLRFAGACGLAVAVIGIATGGATAGAGYETTRALLEGRGDLPGVYTLLKFCATWLSAWSGVPGGIFAPSLAVGAAIGHDVTLLTGLGSDAAIPLIALGMVSFLSATTQGPITAFIIVMEMVSGHAMVLSLMTCSLLASGVSRLISKPLYPELAMMLMLPPEPDPEPPKPPVNSEPPPPPPPPTPTPPSS